MLLRPNLLVLVCLNSFYWATTKPHLDKYGQKFVSSFVQSVDVPSLEDKVRKMIDEDLVMCNFILKFSKL